MGSRAGFDIDDEPADEQDGTGSQTPPILDVLPEVVSARSPPASSRTRATRPDAAAADLTLLQQQISRAREEKDRVEAECARLREAEGGSQPSRARPPEDDTAPQVPMPTRLLGGLLNPAAGTSSDWELGLVPELARTRGSLERLAERVDRLCASGPRASDEAPQSPRQNSAERSSIYRQRRSGYDLEKEESSDQETRGRQLFREVSGEAAPNDLAREVSTERQDILFEDDDVRQSRGVDFEILEHSLATKAPALQGAIYLLALGGIVFTLVYPAIADDEDGQHRRLGGGGSEPASSGSSLADGHGIITAISYSTLAAGLLALIVSFLSQPLLLGYILAGFLVGPEGLVLVEDHTDIKTISELGLVLLLFMIGLELDLHELLKMGKVVLLTGALQFPICASIHLAVFTALSYANLSFGEGQYAVLYIAFCCGISSTMIVVKLLSEKMETDTTAGRLTIGILIFQDIWAIVMLAIQPNMANPEITGLLKTFGFMALLIVVAFSYSKYILPAVFMKASSSPELMLILALAWCFFVCAVAILSFVGLSMELAALIAGVSMATFPYNAELNGKVKYIRDYFITLYFVALGMQIPMPTPDAVGTAAVICVVVLLVRWVGIFSVAYMLGGGSRLAILATVNLSEVSEFGLVLCSIGIKPENKHIEQDTLTIIIWTFAILAVAASYFIGYNHTIHHKLIKHARRLPCARCRQAGVAHEGDEDDEDEEERDIIILGFHKIAAALIAEFEHRSPAILWRLHVIDHKLNLAEPLRKKHITFSYGDITSADVLEHAHHGHADLVLLTMPENAIPGVSNVRLLEVARQVWPKCHIIVIADSPKTTKELYDKGADYVVATKKLSAERIADMLTEHYSDGLAGGELRHHLEYHKENEASWNPKLISLH